MSKRSQPVSGKRFLAIVAAFCAAIFLGLFFAYDPRPWRYVAPVRVGPFEKRPQSEALIKAIEEGRFHQVKLLLDHGVSPDSIVLRGADDGYSALQAAALRDNPAILKLLLERGADVNASNAWGQTAVHSACWGHPESLQVLIDHGADVNALDDGVTALGYATHHLLVCETFEERVRCQSCIDKLNQAGGRSWNYIPFLF